MGKVSVNEIATKLIDSKGLSKKQAASFVNDMFDIIQKGLESDKAAKVKGLGTFKIISVDDRESINVNTGERVLIEGHSKITFTPDPVMKELVNKPFSQFETVVLKDGVDFDYMIEEKEAEKMEEKVEEADASTAPLVDFFAESDVVNKQPFDLQDEPLDSKEEPLVEEQKAIIKTSVEEPVEEKVEKPVEEKVDTIPEQEVKEPEVSESSGESEMSDDSSEEEIIYEEESSDTWKKWLLPVVFCIVGFAAGYLVANMMNGQPATPEQPKQEQVVKPAPKPEPKPVVADSVKQKKVTVVKDSVKSQSEIKPEPKPEPKPKEEVKKEVDKYEKMDPRVLHGAYRIVGTDHVEKIKATDNLARICKRTIGPGMECYLEVYNGIKGDADLKPGNEIKIPKLELKKKKRGN